MHGLCTVYTVYSPVWPCVVFLFCLHTIINIVPILQASVQRYTTTHRQTSSCCATRLRICTGWTDIVSKCILNYIINYILFIYISCPLK